MSQGGLNQGSDENDKKENWKLGEFLMESAGGLSNSEIKKPSKLEEKD